MATCEGIPYSLQASSSFPVGYSAPLLMEARFSLTIKAGQTGEFQTRKTPDRQIDRKAAMLFLHGFCCYKCHALPCSDDVQLPIS